MRRQARILSVAFIPEFNLYLVQVLAAALRCCSLHSQTASSRPASFAREREREACFFRALSLSHARDRSMAYASSPNFTMHARPPSPLLGSPSRQNAQFLD